MPPVGEGGGEFEGGDALGRAEGTSFFFVARPFFPFFCFFLSVAAAGTPAESVAVLLFLGMLAVIDGVAPDLVFILALAGFRSFSIDCGSSCTWNVFSVDVPSRTHYRRIAFFIS